MTEKKKLAKFNSYQTTIIKVKETKAIGSKNLTVKMDEYRYKQLKRNALEKDMTHRDIMLEGFDLWMKVHGTTF